LGRFIGADSGLGVLGVHFWAISPMMLINGVVFGVLEGALVAKMMQTEIQNRMKIDQELITEIDELITDNKNME
jgi:uncharacterized membrane-anchored protein YhcB (DUF1043 family)